MIFVGLLTLIGATLRFTNLNWDLGGMLHPDEAFIVKGAQTIRFFSHMFPGFHDYNGFSIYLLRATAALVATLTGHTAWLTTPEGMTLVGRFISASLATFSIPLVYAVGSIFVGPTVGLIAAFGITFTPLLIQLAHFYTTDTILVFLLLLELHMIALYWYTRRLRFIACMAGAAGLALATKNTAYFFLPLPLMAIMLSKGSAQKKLTPLLIFAGFGIGMFFVGSPYSFLDIGNYISRSREIAEIVNGTILYEWSAQFQHTTPLFWFENLIAALGPLAIIGPIGIATIFSHRSFWHRSNRNFPLILVSFWTIGFSIFLAFTYLKFIRYDAPLVPVYALLTAILLASLWKSFPGKILVAAVLLVHTIWGIMFFHVYLTPHTSVVASDWIASHVPPHATILLESWNGIINFDRPALQVNNYALIPINFYLSESPDKSTVIADALAKSNYIIIESPKVRNTIRRMGAGFQKTDEFYRDLDSGKLGFTKVATFTSYPQLGPLTINDEQAEETWTVFDHPVVSIYQKTSRSTGN